MHQRLIEELSIAQDVQVDFPLFTPFPITSSVFTLHFLINILIQPFSEDAGWEQVWSAREKIPMQDTLNIRKNT